MSRMTLVVFTALFALTVAAPVTAGLVDSPLPVLPSTGKQSKLIYSTTGVINFTDLEASCFSCTNLDKNVVEVGAEIFNFTGSLVNDLTAGNGNLSLNPGETGTICTQDTGFYSEDETMTVGSVNQGSARIVASSKKILCTAQVLDSENDPPTSIATLPMFAKLKQKGD